MSNIVFFFKQCLIFFSTLCHPERVSGSHFFSKGVLILFFITPRHPELDSGSHFYFFKIVFDFFSFLSLLYFYFFIKIITTSSKGKEPARSPKPAVSLPLTPSLLGHGSGLRPKNLPASEIEVSSVSYEQICVALFFFKKDFDSFFLSLLYFYFFHKNYYHFTKGKEPAQSPKPAVSLPLNPSLLGHGLRRCLKNLPTSEIEVSSVSCEQIRVALFFFKIVFDSFLPHHVILNSIQDLTFIFFK